MLSTPAASVSTPEAFVQFVLQKERVRKVPKLLTSSNRGAQTSQNFSSIQPPNTQTVAHALTTHSSALCVAKALMPFGNTILNDTFRLFIQQLLSRSTRTFTQLVLLSK
jgi:hypothetical protein